MSVFEIPLRPRAQKLRVEINGIEYVLRVRWNNFSNCWIMDIADTSNVPLLNGIPLITGANLLDQFDYLGIGNRVKVLVYSTGNPDEVPTYASLGSTSRLYFVT